MKGTSIVTRDWAVTVAELRRDFATELREDGFENASDAEVARQCWDNGVREPYFEIQEADEDFDVA